MQRQARDSGDGAADEMISHWRSGDAPSEIFSAEQIANSVSHGIGLGMSIVGLVVLLFTAAVHGEAVHMASAAIYGSTLVLLFAASTVYHSMRRPALRRAFRVVDHSAIFLLIAGTYTPFTLVSLPGGWGWTLFGIAWGLALIGVIYKVFWFGRFKGASLALYLLMGWTIVVAIKPLLEALDPGGLILLFAGGLLYTGGVVFYVWEDLFFNHAIWHLFVLAAAACHYLAILFFVMM